MSHQRTSCAHSVARLSPRVKIWFEQKGEYVFGYGLAQMLAAVEETGSIKDAAKKLGKSYRYVWGRVKEAEAALGQPLVSARVGGSGTHRSCLTPLAARLTADFLALRKRVFDLVEQEFSGRFGALDVPEREK